MITGRLTAVLFGLGLLLFTLVPVFREGLVVALCVVLPKDALWFDPSVPSTTELERVALGHPEDAQIWLGYAEAMSYLGLTSHKLDKWTHPKTTVEDAYRIALALHADPQTIRLRHALYCLEKLALSVGVTHSLDQRRPEERALSTDEIALLRTAKQLLVKCREADSDNAACDYLLAWGHSVASQDEQALDLLQAGLAKDHWNTYDRQAAEAVARIFGESRMPAGLQTLNVRQGAYLTRPLLLSRSMADILAFETKDVLTTGHHEPAIMRLECLVHLGHLMRIDAYSMNEGLNALQITGTPARLFWADEESARTPSRINYYGEDGLMLYRASARKFAAYLHQHGRDELASFYLQDVEAGIAWRGARSEVISRDASRFDRTFLSTKLLHIAGAFATVGGMLVAGLPILLMSLLLRHWLQRRPRLAWSWREWLIALAVCAIPAQAYATYHTWLAGRVGHDYYWGVGWMWAKEGSMVTLAPIPTIAAVGVALWLVAVLILALLKCRHHQVQQGPGVARTYVTGLRALVVPTLAGLVLLSLLTLWPWHVGLQHFDQEQLEIIRQGDVQYWEIDT